MIKLIAEREGVLVVQDESGIDTIPVTPYNLLKFKTFCGNRIIYKISDDVEITETFDNGIFNIKVKQEMMQFRNRDEIANLISSHQKKRSEKSKEKVVARLINHFAKLYSEKYNMDLIKGFITQFGERVKLVDKSFIIDEIFKIDDVGQAWVLQDKKWKSLCIVVKLIKGDMKVKTSFGDVSLTETGITIINKIIFLMKPNMKDDVFINQLPNEIRKILEINNPEPKTEPEGMVTSMTI